MHLEKIEKIYFDIDGVMADWLGGVAKSFGVHRHALAHRVNTGMAPAQALGISNNSFWARLDHPEFWAKLEPFAPTLQLWHDFRDAGLDCCVLTAPSQAPSCLSGKLMWLQTYLGGRNFRDYIMTRRKGDLGGPGRLLLDDREKNIGPFTAAGGMAIHFPTEGNEIRADGATVQDACDEARRLVFG